MTQESSEDQRFVKILSKVFVGMDESMLGRILKDGIIRHIDSGDTLFRQGETDKTMFIVLSGRFRVIARMDDGLHNLGDVGEGEPIGEFALFSNEPRIATVYALRYSVVLALSENEYLQVVSLFPAFASKMTEILLKRMTRNNLQRHLASRPKIIVIINLQANNDISPWTKAIEKELEIKSVQFQVYSEETLSMSNQKDIFESLEGDDGLKFMICSDANSSWTQKCLLYADLIILATDFYAPSQLYDIEQQRELYKENILNKKIYLLLLHPENARQPENTKRWFDHRKIDLHIHFRKNHSGDASRVCRILNNKAVGLVLGGGGAKGFAHVGAVKAMINAGIPIDILGGTSAGALYGFGTVFSDFDPEKIDFYTAQGVNKKLTSNDYTLPVISFLSGKKMSTYLKDLFGNTCIEDFWISSYCISSNFTNASVSTHNSGLAWKKVLASMAVPGVFPPVIIDNELHVDGCVMDNLPIKAMYHYPVGHVIALALSGLAPRKVDVNEIPSSTTILWDNLFKKKKHKLPGLSSIIINSLTLNSTQRQEKNKSDASFYIELDLKGFSFLDDTKWKEIVQKGYDQIADYFEKLDAKEKFW